MEDGVTDAERLPPPPSELINSHLGAVQETAGDSGHANIENDEKRGGGGLLSNLISNLVVPRSVAETGEDEKGDDINRSREQGKENEDGKEGGFINHLISNMVSPSNREVGGGGKAEVENGGGGGGGGGLINNLITNIFNQSDHQDEGLKENSEEEKQSEDGKEEGGGGGGIINNLISHLPASLSGN